MNRNVSEVTDSSFGEVIQKGALVLVDFWAAWCPPCRTLAPVLEQVAGEYEGIVRFIKVNVDDSPSTAQRYGIMSIPTLILFQNGEEEERIMGAASKNVISRMINEYLRPEAA